MQAIRSTNTKPELAVRQLVHSAGLRYRVHFPPLAGLRRRADLVFTKQRVAVFIDGCFWHGCLEHHHDVATNSQYWSPKLLGNRERDRDTTSKLEAAGWIVLRYWEHQQPAEVADDIERNVRSIRGFDNLRNAIGR
jgi:DNA mismatch endonuclease (patch repair protein)